MVDTCVDVWMVCRNLDELQMSEMNAWTDGGLQSSTHLWCHSLLGGRKRPAPFIL